MQIINPLTHPGYDELILDMGGSFFHSSHWAKVLHESYGYRPCYFTRIQNDRLAILLPMMEVKSFLTGRRGVSLPFTDYCEPILSVESDWQEVQEFLKSYGEKEQWKHWELRGGAHLMGQEFCSSFYYRHNLKLSDDLNALYAGVKSSTKRNIKKATREGVIVIRDNSFDAVKTFYSLHCLTRKKHGLPPQPFHFFQKLYDHVIRQGQGQVFIAKYQGKAIGGAIYLQFGREVIYKFGASDTKHLHLRPNDIVMWTALQWYSGNGFANFCFGRTEPDNEGLRQFKCGWGAKESTIKYHRYDLRNKTYVVDSPQLHGFHNKVFSGMPVPFLKLAGSLLYKHMG